MKLFLKKGSALLAIELLLLAGCLAGIGASNAWAAADSSHKALVKAVDYIEVTYEDPNGGGTIDVYDGDSLFIPAKGKRVFTAIAYDVDGKAVKTKLAWTSSDKKIAKAFAKGVVAMSGSIGTSAITISEKKSGTVFSFEVSSEEDLGIAAIGIFDENDFEITDGMLYMSVDDVARLTPKAFDEAGAEVNVDLSMFHWMIDYSTPKDAIICDKDGVVSARDAGEASITISIGTGSFEVAAQFGVNVQ